jgi:hypothetical protein
VLVNPDEAPLPFVRSNISNCAFADACWVNPALREPCQLRYMQIGKVKEIVQLSDNHDGEPGVVCWTLGNSASTAWECRGVTA